MTGNIGTALVLTTAAGLSTTVGSVLGILVKNPGRRLMSATLGFAAGVLLYISFGQLLPTSIEKLGFPAGNGAFFAGVLAMFLLDYLTPHEYFGEHHGGENARLLRTGLFVALGLAIHNFPEGLATFAGTLHDVRLGGAIAVAVAVHNIPEGLAVAAPIYAATGSRKKAFLYSFLSGLAEPLGAIMAAVVLYRFLTDTVLGIMVGAVAGLMVYVSLDELIPASREYGHEHLTIMSAAAGMGVMAASLYLLEIL